MTNEQGLEELRQLRNRYPESIALNEFYQDVAAIIHHDPTNPLETLDWNWIMQDAYRRLNEMK